MKIFRNIFVIVAFALAAASCRNEEVIEFALDTSEINIGPDGGVKTIKISSW